MSAVKAFLIEPMAGTIRPVSINLENRHTAITDLLGCMMTDFVRLGDNNVVFVDFNGLDETVPYLTEVAGGASPLAGNLLLARMDENGELVDMTETIEDAARRFTIVRVLLQTAMVVSEIIDTEQTYIARVSIGLGRSTPEVTEAAEA